MSYISYYDFIEAIRKWDVKIVKVLIDKVKQLKIPRGCKNKTNKISFMRDF